MDHSHHAYHTAAPPIPPHPPHPPPMPMRCKMNMLWNTDIIDTCIVFRSWHISSYTIFYLSCLAIILLGILHEYVRVLSRKVDYQIALGLSTSAGERGRGGTRGRHHSQERSASGSASPTGVVNLEETGLLSGSAKILTSNLAGTPVPFIPRLIRSTLYAFSVFLSFFLMLVFMTYNAYLIAATVLGAAIGHYIFGSTINTELILKEDNKGMACH